MYSNQRELLFAYHDALQGASRGKCMYSHGQIYSAHRRLYPDAGILHRDVQPGNILLYPDGEEGNWNILIDYDHAIRIADTSSYSTKKKIVHE